MSSPIEEKIVKLTLQYGSLETGAQKAKGLLDRITDSIKSLGKSNASGAEKSIDAIADSSSKAVGGMNELSEATTGTGNKFSMLRTVAAGALLNIGAMASSAAVNLAKSLTIDPIMGGFREYELKLKSMQTIMTNTGRSVQDVNAVLNDLNSYSDKTIYNFNDMTSAIGSLSTSGLALEDSASAVKGFYNLAAGTGIEAARAGSLLETAMIQAINIGKMDYQNWKQLSQAGMGGPKFKDALLANAAALGKNVDLSEGFNESLKQGWATTDVMLATLKQFENDKSLLDAATRVKSLTQLIGTLQEKVESGWAESFEIIFGDFDAATILWTTISNAIEPIIDATTNLRNNFLSAFKAAGGFSAIAGIFVNIGIIIGNIAKAIMNAFKSVTALGKGFGTLPAAIALPFKMVEFLTRKLSEITIIPKLIGLAFKVLFLALSPIASILMVIGSLIGKLWSAFEISINFIFDLVRKLSKFIVDMFTIAITKVKEFGTAVKSVTIDPLVNSIKFLASTIKGAFSTAIKSVLDLFGKIGGAIKESFETFSIRPLLNLFKQLADAIKEVVLVPFKMNWGEALQPIGREVVQLVKAFGELAIVKSVKKNIDELIQTIADMKIIEKSKNMVDSFSKAYGSLQKSMMDKYGINIDVKFQANKLKNAILEIEAVQTAISKISEVKDAVVDFVDTTTMKMGTTRMIFTAFGKSIKDSFQTKSLEPLQNFFVGMGEIAKTNLSRIDFSPLVSSAKNAFSNIDFSFVANQFEKLKSITKNAFSNVDFSGIVTQFEKLKTATMNAFKDFNFSTITDQFEKLKSAVKGFDFGDINSGLSSLGKTISGSFGNIDFSPLQGKLDLLKGAFEIAFGAIRSAAEKLMSIPIFDYLQNGVQKVIDFIGGFNFWTVADATSEGVNSTIKAIGGLNAKTTESEGIMSRAFKKIVEVIKIAAQYTVEGLGMMAYGIAAAFKAIVPFIKGVFDSIKDFAGTLKEKLGDTLSTENLVKGGIVVYLGLLLKSIANFKRDAGDMFKSIGGFFDGFGKIGDIFDSITNALGKFNKTVTPGNILKVGIAIGILALSLKLLSTIDAQDIGTSLAVLTGALAGLVGSMIAIEKFGGSSAKVAASGAAMFTMGLALLAVAAAVKILSGIDAGDMFKAIGAVLVLITGMSLALVGISKFGSSITVGLSGMIGMAIAIMILASAVKKFADIPNEDLLRGGAAVIVALIAMAAALKIMGSVKFSLGTGLAVVAIANALVVLADAVKILGAMDTEAMKQGMIGVGLLLAGLTISLIVLGKSQGSVLAAGLAIMVVALALKMLVPAVSILGSMKLGTLAQGLIALGLMLGGITLALSILSGNAGGNLAAAASIAIVAGALTLLIIPITILGTMKWQTLAQGLIAMALALGIVVIAGYAATGASAGLGILAGVMLSLALAAIGIGLALTATIAILEFFTSSTKDSFDILVENIIHFLTKLEEVIPAVVSFVGAAVDGLVQAVTENLPKLIQMGFDIVQAFLNGIANNLPQLMETATKIIVEFINGLSEGLPQIIMAAANFILEFIRGLTEAVTTYGPDIKIAILDLIQAILNVIWEGSGDMYRSALEFISGFINGAVTKAGEIWGAVSDFFTSLPGKISDAIGDIRDKATSFIGGFIDGAVEKARGLWGAISDFFTSLSGKISDGVGDLYDSGASIISRFVSGITDGISGAQKAVEGGIKKIRDFFPFSPAKKGPFSGKGWVLYSGRSIMTAMAKGINDTTGSAVRAASMAMDNVQDKLSATVTVEPVVSGKLFKIEDLSQSARLFTNTTIQGTVSYESKMLDKFDSLGSDLSKSFDASLKRLSDKQTVVEWSMDGTRMGNAVAKPVTAAQERSTMFERKFNGR